MSLPDERQTLKSPVTDQKCEFRLCARVCALGGRGALRASASLPEKIGVEVARSSIGVVGFCEREGRARDLGKFLDFSITEAVAVANSLRVLLPAEEPVTRFQIGCTQSERVKTLRGALLGFCSQGSRAIEAPEGAGQDSARSHPRGQLLNQ